MASTNAARNEKAGENEEIVPMTFAAAPLNPSAGNHQPQQYTYHEEQEIAPEMIQVVTVNDGRQQQEEGVSPLISRQQQVEALLPPQELDPTTIQIVTFDEATSDQQQQQSYHEEATPLLHHDNGRTQDDVYSSNTIQEEDDNASKGGGAMCRDFPWAVLFWLHLAVVLFLGFQISPKGYAMMEEVEFDIDKIHDFLQQNAVNDDDFTGEDLEMLTHFLRDFQSWWGVYPPRILWFSLIMCWVSFCLNMVKNHLIIRPFTLYFVASSLVLPVVILAAIVILSLVSDPNIWVFLFGALCVGLLALFIRKTLWPKIRFASINLQIALDGIGQNLGTYVWVLGCAEITVLWVIFWGYTTMGLVSYMNATYCPSIDTTGADNVDGLRFLTSKHHKDDDDPPSCGPASAAVLALMVSFYWTCSFIGVFVAGVMATWCFDKNSAKGCCSTAVTSSMYRSVTFSSGPIAFGSLLQGICKMIRSVLSHSNRSHGRDNYVVHDIGDDCQCCCFGLVGLVLDCLSDLFGDVLDYFSQWAYVFVGIYGHSYLESGKAVMDLFRNRGWMALITDRLIFFVLGVGIFESGLVTGLAAIVVERLITSFMYGHDDEGLPPSFVFGAPPSAGLASFLAGFVIGCVLSSIVMSVLHGAVNTLIVCWAESPASFTENHKRWADKMTRIWSSAYPGTQIQQQSYHHSASGSSTTTGQMQSSSTNYGAANSAII